MPGIHISKLDAAKRQLHTAIKLFFKEDDPVSIHTLTAAAYDILHALCEIRGIKVLVKNNEAIREERKKEYLEMLNAAQNFFKHADRDPDAVHEFFYEATAFFLWDACNMYKQLTGEMPKDFYIFSMWFGLAHPGILNPAYKDTWNQVREVFDPTNKKAFYTKASETYDLAF